MLELLARRIPALYEDLAVLVREVQPSSGGAARAKGYLRLAMEEAAATADTERLQSLWFRMEQLCKETSDVEGEIEALTEGALVSVTGGRRRTLSQAANRLNSRMAALRGHLPGGAQGPEVKARIERFVTEMDRDSEALTATDCSRLAWLHLRLGNKDRGCDLTEQGLRQEPEHEYCRNLAQRLGLT